MAYAGSVSFWMGELSFMNTSQDKIAASAKSKELVVFSMVGNSAIRLACEFHKNRAAPS